MAGPDGCCILATCLDRHGESTMPKNSASPKSKARQKHPVVASAERAIRRNLSARTAQQVFVLAALADVYRYGKDRARWSLSAEYAASHPAEMASGAR